jgi:glycosyltransferase involved in cell wall biosynthesis
VGAPLRPAFVHGVPIGVGGLGVQAANALRALALSSREVHAIGPGPSPGWNAPANVVWHIAPASRLPPLRWTPARRHHGYAQFLSDRRIGRFAVTRLRQIAPDLCYAFTQVALEPLMWARACAVPAVLESPNGGIRAFRQVYLDETRRWCGGRYLGHPTVGMVARVEQEYELATDIRVSSDWARRSLVDGGVPPERIVTLQQPVDVRRYTPSDGARPAGPALHVCCVGSLDLRKGFPYLLRAVRAARASVTLRLVGGTGDRCCRRLLERERQGLKVEVTPGDPRPALAQAELFVLPTLEDGSPFAVAEAMASGLPVVTTTGTGASEWVRPGRSGWIVEPASETALAAALDAAFRVRPELRAMGLQARSDTVRRVEGCDAAFADWIQRL